MYFLDYGKSMYGDWYATYFDGEWKGIGARTLQELKGKLTSLGLTFDKTKRRDYNTGNIF